MHARYSIAGWFLQSGRLRSLRAWAAAALLWTCPEFGHAVDVIAHRGGYALAPENTLAAFRLSMDVADWIEFDVRETKDGHLVVIHDETVNRTTDGTGRVDQLTLAQIKTLDAGSWFSPAFAGERIPTFAEALQTIGTRSKIFFERKTGPVQAYLDAIYANNCISNVVVTSFDWVFLRDVRLLDPRLPLAYLSHAAPPSSSLATLTNNGIYGLALNKIAVTPGAIALAREHGMTLYAWTFDSLDVQSFPFHQFDGIIAIDPALAKKLVHTNQPSNQQMARGLAAYWKLDDGLSDPSARQVRDVGNFLVGERPGHGPMPIWLPRAQSRMGSSLRFDGMDSHIMFPRCTTLDIATNSVTLSLWINLEHLPSQLAEPYAGIFDSVEDSYVLYLDQSACELRFKITDTAQMAARPGIPEAKLTTGKWHHVVGVFDGSASPAAGQAMIYLDGILQHVRTGDDATPGWGLVSGVRPGQTAALGRNGVDNRFYFAGAIDDVAVWRRALAPAEIALIHSAGTNGIPLERHVMALQARPLLPAEPYGFFEVGVQADNAVLADQTVQLLSSPHPEGPYAPHAAQPIWDGPDLRFRVQPAELPGPARYFRIVSPAPD